MVQALKEDLAVTTALWLGGNSHSLTLSRKGPVPLKKKQNPQNKSQYLYIICKTYRGPCSGMMSPLPSASLSLLLKAKARCGRARDGTSCMAQPAHGELCACGQAEPGYHISPGAMLLFFEVLARQGWGRSAKYNIRGEKKIASLNVNSSTQCEFACMYLCSMSNNTADRSQRYLNQRPLFLTASAKCRALPNVCSVYAGGCLSP